LTNRFSNDINLPGYIHEKKKQGFIDYSFVLEEYQGDKDMGTAIPERPA